MPRALHGSWIIEDSLVQGWFVIAVALLAGLCLGSFLNVVIDRLPTILARQWRTHALETLHIEPPAAPRFNLALPRSHCAHCGVTIEPTHNIPVAGWLMLRGRCAACQARISVRLPIVEFMGGVLALTVIGMWGYTWIALAHYAFLMALLALAVIDAETKLLPDQITLPLLWLGLIVAAAFETTPALVDALAGAIAGYLALWFVYWLFKLVTRREGMGYGDFKLMAAIGAWLGWRSASAVILIAAVLGLTYALITILGRTATRATPIPFGPFLAFSATLALFLSTRMPVLVLSE